MILLQTCQIISGPAPTEQQTKEQARYWQTRYIMKEINKFSLNSEHISKEKISTVWASALTFRPPALHALTLL